MALRPLLVRIGGDTSGLEKALDRADRGLKGLAVAAGAAGVAVAGGLAAMAASGVGLARDLETLSQRGGASVESLQRMAAATRTVGLDLEKTSDILQDMNDRVGDFLSTGGGPMADFFENIAPKVGITAEQFARLSGPEALQLYVTSLEKAGLTQSQMTFYMEALSSESTRLLPLLLDNGRAMTELGDAAAASGQIIDGEMVESIARAGDALTIISGAFDALKLRLAGEVAPVLEYIAQRFQQLAASEQVQAGVQKIADAFGRLAQAVMSEGFLDAATSGLTLLVDVATGAANAVQFLQSHVEAATVAMSALAIALAAVGGPLTLTVAALAAALGGISMWRAKAEDAGVGSDAAAEAQARLNAALGVFHQTAAPAAGKAAVALANDNYKLADSAVAAAEAELAKRQAILDAEAARIEAVNSAAGEYLTTGTSLGASVDVSQQQSILDAARARLEESRLLLDRTVREVSGADYSAPTIEPIALPEVTLPEFPGLDGAGGAVPGLSGGAAVADQFAGRYEALTTGLSTEAELLAEWYDESRAVLDERLASEKITEEEHKMWMERLEEEHQERLAKIRKAGSQAAVSTLIGAGKEILSAIGQNNEKAAKAAQTLGAFEAMVNAYRAASQALSDPTLPWFAKAGAAASLLATGIGFANSIRSMSSSGSGGGGGGVSTSVSASTSAASTQGQAAQAPVQVSLTELSGQGFFGDLGGLLTALQDEADARDRGLVFV